jgi:DNA helicase-2/ATP-dependent DNA helicase PcrA
MASGKLEGLAPAVRAKVDAFECLIQTLHEESKTAAPSAFVRRVIQLSGLEDALAKGGEDDQERLENAKELATLASRYDASPGEEGINAFLTDTALAGDQDELDRPQSNEKNTGGVTLMTVHAAKGLEFDVVFVSGLEEGLFPHEGMNQEEERDEEEERRLFYVAMTRAKHHLILSMARVRRIYGTDYLSEPSSFLHDIDPGLMSVHYGEEEHEEVIHI